MEWVFYHNILSVIIHVTVVHAISVGRGEIRVGGFLKTNDVCSEPNLLDKVDAVTTLPVYTTFQSEEMLTVNGR
jgi:hypothetical protein